MTGGDDGVAVEFALSAEDYADFVRFAATGPRFRRRKILVRRLISVGAPPLVLSYVAFAYDVPPVIAGVPTLVLFVASGLVLGVFWTALFWLLGREANVLVARWRLRLKSYKEFLQPARIELSPDGLKRTDASGPALTGWPAVVEIAKNRQAIYAYISPIQAHIIPRRAFPNDAAFDCFAAKLAQYQETYGSRASGAR